MLQFAKATHTGLVRSHNEDAVDFVPGERWLMVLCDGMGGHSAGEVASQTAVELLCAEARSGAHTVAEYRKAIGDANAAVYGRSSTDARTHGMGTTLVLAFGQGREAVVANVGDSRAYLLRAETGVLRRITRDHSLVEEMLLSGQLTAEEAKTYPFRNVITRAVGTSPEVVPDLFEVELAPGDVLLLCSDGLTNEVPDGVIRFTLLGHPDPQAACEALLQKALDAGARDNVSICVAKVPEEGGEQP